mmetsp:Transcript_63924/g.152463  ORF Transcript_63924/g.152463 Transcript_63924/m.152463 type:complete len:110 (-) Transcript_63924:135-464(-)
MMLIGVKVVGIVPTCVFLLAQYHHYFQEADALPKDETKVAADDCRSDIPWTTRVSWSDLGMQKQQKLVNLGECCACQATSCFCCQKGLQRPPWVQTLALVVICHEDLAH